MKLGPVKFGIDRLLADKKLLTRLKERKAGLVAHPASTTSTTLHSLDALIAAGAPFEAAFGPQHGMRGDKQDNMIESENYIDPHHQIPVYSLYGEHRRPTTEMLDDLDIIVVDLQDLGCRIYTYIATLSYFIDACTEHQKTLWILDRPNPAGRPIDGLCLLEGEESLVGCDTLPCRHGLTVGEFSRWYAHKHGLDLDYRIIEMEGYAPDDGPGYGWPISERSWINPSPNASSLNMARCFPGTVLIEGTELSEGRGTTIPLEVIGAPDLPVAQLLKQMQKLAPAWLEGVYIRRCFFEPTFHKHKEKLCEGIQIHTDHKNYRHHQFRPFRLVALLLKAIRTMDKDYPLWRHHLYEYESGRIPIDVINGGPYLREWVDDAQACVSDLESMLERDEKNWIEQREQHLLY